MNLEEKFTKMEQGVEDIRVDIAEIKHALIGSSMSGDKGLIGQVNFLKAETEHLKKDLGNVQKDAIENKLIITQLKYVTGVAVTSLVAILIKIIFT
jgi:ABC-type phosphate/phosphonate transport system ATPase subunit